MSAHDHCRWFRRDLRLADQPTLLAAATPRRRRSALFVLRPGAARRRPGRPAGLPLPAACARSTSRIGGRLLVVRGDPADGGAARSRRPSTRRPCTSPPTTGPTAAGATRPSAKALGRRRSELVRTGSPYAVAPGRVRKADGDAVQGLHAVLPRPGPQHGWRAPADTDARRRIDWLTPRRDRGRRRRDRVAIPDDERLDAELPEAGEAAARSRGRSSSTAPSTATTTIATGPTSRAPSRMSPYLKYGCDPSADAAGRPGRRRGPTRPRPTAPSWPGGSSTPTSSATAPTRRAENYDRRDRRAALDDRRQRRRAVRGLARRAGPASRSSTPGCGSCWPRPGCTTGCG